MLSAEHLGVIRAQRSILSDVSLQLDAGELTGVLGANGAGKSTLLMLLAAEMQSSVGHVFLHGAGMPSEKALARLRAVLPQTPSLMTDMPVSDIIAMGAYAFPELNIVALESLVRECLLRVDSANLCHRDYLALSGGEQQRVQFARVLVQILAAREPEAYRYILLDEPTASLDPKYQRSVLAALKQVIATTQTSGLMVVHDVNLAAAWCDRLVLLADGQLIAAGRPADVLTPDNLMTVYGLSAVVIPHPLNAKTPWVIFDVLPT